MSNTTLSRRAPLCQSCGKSTRHHSTKYCRPCAESMARFAEKFDGRGSGVEPAGVCTMSNATLSNAATLSKLTDKLTQSLAELRTEREWAGRIMTSTPFVVGWPENSLFVRVSDEGKAEVSCLKLASRWSRAGAERATKNDNIRNGAGQPAVVIGYIQAIDACIAHVEETLADVIALGE